MPLHHQTTIVVVLKPSYVRRCLFLMVSVFLTVPGCHLSQQRSFQYLQSLLEKKCLLHSRPTLPFQIDVTSRQLIFWKFSTHKSLISATTFIKNGLNFAAPRLFHAPRNQVVQLPITPLFQPLHHSKLENVFDFLIKVWNNTKKCMTMDTEK